ncbi:MAG TPA: hypothetical protein VND23_10995 [Acidimicrobiales bacterium]|nr:hypothetical protein [Acidimicrobiales bacterium]
MRSLEIPRHEALFAGEVSRRHRLPTVLAGARLALAVTALCGAVVLSSATAGAASTTYATSAAVARARITTSWKAFFAGSTSAARKIALLQDGSRFAADIRGQASSALARSVAAKVSRVTLTSSSSASVRYSLTLGGQPALTNQTGRAVLEHGKWKVGDSSFCALLALEQVKAAACPKS